MFAQYMSGIMKGPSLHQRTDFACNVILLNISHIISTAMTGLSNDVVCYPDISPMVRQTRSCLCLLHKEMMAL